MFDKVSVIIAAYNEEKNIEKCIESILNQDYEDIELIIINDGSTDGTADILRKYKNHSNILVYNIQNSGVSNARNVGIRKSSGKWILFADADDYYCNGAISQLVRTAKDTGCYVVQGGLNRSHTVEQRKNNIEKVHIISSGIVAQVLLDYDAELSNEITMFDRHMRLSTHGPYGKLICKEIIDNKEIEFDVDMGLGEDLFFYFKILNTVEKIAIFENDVYVVQDNPNSSTRRFNERMPEFSIIFTNKIIEYMKEYNIYDEYKNNLHFQIYMHIMVAIKSYYLHDDNMKSDYKIAKELRDFMNYGLFNLTLQNISESNMNISRFNKLLVWLLNKKHTFLYVKMYKFRKMVLEGKRK